MSTFIDAPQSSVVLVDDMAAPAARDTEDEQDEADESKLSELIEEFGCRTIGVDAEVSNNEFVQLVKPTKFAHFHCPNTLPLPALWPDRPLLMREGAASLKSSTSDSPPMRMDATPFDFETGMFKGQVMTRIRTNPKCHKYFEGKHRLSSVVITGKFKEPIKFSDFVTGQEFCHPVKTPGILLTRAMIGAVKLISPLISIQMNEHATHMFSPVAQSVPAMHIGKEPFELTPNCIVTENTMALGGKLKEKPILDSLKRKKYFSNRKHLGMYEFDTEHVYTFDFYNDKIDLDTFEGHLLGRKFGLSQYLLGQPVRILARVLTREDRTKQPKVGMGNKSKRGQDRDDDDDDDSATRSQRASGGPYVWNFEMWHECQTELLQKKR